MKQATQLSRNQARKMKYASQAADQDKGVRNAAIEAALGKGAENVTAHDIVDGFTRVTVEWTDGEYRTIKIPNFVERKQIVAPAMPAAPRPGSRAAKRAALKAQRHKIVRDRTPHKRGERTCGNAGCSKCHPRKAA